MVQNVWGLDMTHLRIWKEIAKLLQYMEYDNPENFSLISCTDCTDYEKSLFKVSKVRLKAPKFRVKVILYDFRNFILSTNPRWVVFYKLKLL